MRPQRLKQRIIGPILWLGIPILLFWLFWFGWVGLSDPHGSTVEVVVGNSLITPGHSVRLRPGSYTVTLQGPRLTKKTEHVFVWPFFKKTIVNNQKEITDNELVAQTVGAKSNDIQIYSLRYFENNTWFVAYVGPAGNTSDVGPTIAKYQSGSWTVIDSGTGTDFSSNAVLPKSIRDYFKGSGS